MTPNATRLRRAELFLRRIDGGCNEVKTLFALIQQAKSAPAENSREAVEPKPIGYINKKDLARLQDEITWDGSYLMIGVDHFAQWMEDTPYEHLAPIYAAPPSPDVGWALDAIDAAPSTANGEVTE